MSFGVGDADSETFSQGFSINSMSALIMNYRDYLTDEAGLSTEDAAVELASFTATIIDQAKEEQAALAEVKPDDMPGNILIHAATVDDGWPDDVSQLHGVPYRK